MKLHNFFIEQSLGDLGETVVTDHALLNQWNRVLRLHVGQQVVLLNNSGFQFLSNIVSLNHDEARLTVLSKEKNKNIPRRELWLYMSLVKKDKFEWVLEKGTELGVTHFVPVLAERSEKKSFDEVRARKIIKEAAEQSGRGTLPVLHETIKSESISAVVPLAAFHLDGTPVPKEILEGAAPLGVLVGPEGGWSEKEITFFKGENIPIYCLGTQVLRAETAAIAACVRLLTN
jgi:16S rRNA (uracil1498-N3)-methyltransferase